MTPIEERNLKIMKDSVNLAGFEGKYDKAIEEGIAAGHKEITFDPPGHKKYDDLTMVWEPKMTEGKTPGLYNFNGFQATLFDKNDKELATQFISNMKTKGMTLDQSYTALMGGTVLHSDWDMDKDERRMVFTRLDMTQITPKGQHPVIRVNAERVNLLALMSHEKIVGNTKQLDSIMTELQTGKPVFAHVRETVEGVEKQVPVFLMLNLKNTKEMGMQVIDPTSGELRREPIELTAQRSMTKTEGLEVSQSKETALPEGILRSLNAPRSELGTEDGKQMMSPDALLRKFNASKAQGTPKENDAQNKTDNATKTETQKETEKKEGKVPDNVKKMLNAKNKIGKGPGKKNVA